MGHRLFKQLLENYRDILTHEMRASMQGPGGAFDTVEFNRRLADVVRASELDGLGEGDIANLVYDLLPEYVDHLEIGMPKRAA